MSRKVAVFNVPNEMSCDQLMSLLSKFGEIVDCTMKKSIIDNLGFITFNDSTSSSNLIKLDHLDCFLEDFGKFSLNFRPYSQKNKQLAKVKINKN